VAEKLETTKLVENQEEQEEQPPTNDDLLENHSEDVPLYEDPSDDDDGEGEWITPSNVSMHKSQALNLVPAKGGAKEPVVTGCMTTDFAMQNMLLHMGLSLVGVDGKKIDRVKTWVLRCHACFK
jgi:RNA-binding protein NOB1